MSRATLEELERWGLPASALSSIPTDTQQAELDAAAEFCNGFLRVRYTLPLVSFGVDLKQAECKVAAYNLLAVRGYNPSGADENLRLRYEDAVRWLKAVAAGDITPAIVDSTASEDLNVPLIDTDEPRGW
jgi:phage gp36-like protein